MSTSTVEVFIATYGTEDGAVAAAKDFEAAQRDGAIDLIDAAVIVHTQTARSRSTRPPIRAARSGRSEGR